MCALSQSLCVRAYDRGGGTRVLAVPRPVRWSRRRRRAGLAVALVAVALVTGSSLAVLAIFAAFVLVLDVLIPVPGGTWSAADDHFARLLRRRRLGHRALELFDDGAGWERRDRGVQAIAVGSISGTVEAAKARAFDGAFRPAAGEAEHWKRLWLAQAHGASLPPISVYRIGGLLCPRDVGARPTVPQRSVANSSIA